MLLNAFVKILDLAIWDMRRFEVADIEAEARWNRTLAFPTPRTVYHDFETSRCNELLNVNRTQPDILAAPSLI